MICSMVPWKESEENLLLDFPSGTVDKNLPASAWDTGSIPGPGRLHMSWAAKQAHVPQPPSLHSRAYKPQLRSPCTAGGHNSWGLSI